MIPRYSRSEMANIWTDGYRFGKMLEVEILACEALARQGLIPKKSASVIRRRARINPKRILKIESVVKHDVIAFLTQVGETIGPDAKYIHMGLTSSDVLDTALASQLLGATNLLIRNFRELLPCVRKLANKYRDLPMAGRTHGIHAEPITFGLKVAGWYQELLRGLDRLKAAREVIRYGKISGAVGTYAHISPSVEAYVCRKMDLKIEPVSTQVIPRDRHAEYLSHLAVIAAGFERIATEIRHLQRTEVREIEEPFTKGQKGSSAMPHKRNPIISENLCGLARLMRNYASCALQNVALWHERDISHSSVERVILPDATILLDYMIYRIKETISGLRVYPENIRKNLDKTSAYMSSQKLMLALVKRGMDRKSAYKIAQDMAFATQDSFEDFKQLAFSNKKVTSRLSRSEIQKCLELPLPKANIAKILKRAGITS